MLAWSAAVAALLAVVFWWPRPTPKPRVAVQPVPKIIQPIDWDSTLTHLPSVPVGAVVSEVRSGMNEAVAQIGQNVNGALEAPVVTGGVAAVRHVAGELQEFASVTWDQLRPRQGP